MCLQSHMWHLYLRNAAWAFWSSPWVVYCACRMLPGPNLELTMEGCSRLEVLDAQHSEVPCGAGARLHEACPALRTLLQTEPPRPPPPRPIILDSPEPSESGSTCY